MLRSFLWLLSASLSAFSPSQSFAADWVGMINDYTASLVKVEVDFSQRSENEPPASGRLYLDRKAKKMKVVYDDEIGRGRIIVADSDTLTHYDPTTQSFATYPLESTAAAVFLQKQLSDSAAEGEFYITAVNENPTSIAVEVATWRNGEEKQPLRLLFAKSPFHLLGWELENGFGESVVVRLGDIIPGSFPEGFFDLGDPRPKPF